MKRFRGIHHLAMATRDMDGTIRYWRDLLGMRLAVGIGKPGYRHYFFEIARGFFIAFFEWPDVEPVPEKDHGYPVSGPAVFDHVSFAVESEDELWNLKASIEAAGFWTSEIIDHGFIHSLYSYDPNGIPVEFSLPVRDLDFHETAAMIDSAPSAITLEGPEPQPGKWPTPASPVPEAERRVYPGEGLDLVRGNKRNRFQ